MLQLHIKSREMYNETTGEFIELKNDLDLQLEHSLVSISKWEAKWKKPYLDEKAKTADEFIDYIRCMTLTQRVDPIAYFLITPAQLSEVKNYIEDSMTATWFRKTRTEPSRKIITSEVIYSHMVALNIPFDPCQKWHLNRLMTLIKVCSEQQAPKKKRKQKEIAQDYDRLNEERCKRLKTKG